MPHLIHSAPEVKLPDPQDPTGTLPTFMVEHNNQAAALADRCKSGRRPGFGDLARWADAADDGRAAGEQAARWARDPRRPPPGCIIQPGSSAMAGSRRRQRSARTS